MTRKIKIDEAGDTDLLPGTMIDMFDYYDENERVLELGGEPAKGERCPLVSLRLR